MEPSSLEHCFQPRALFFSWRPSKSKSIILILSFFLLIRFDFKPFVRSDRICFRSYQSFTSKTLSFRFIYFVVPWTGWILLDADGFCLLPELLDLCASVLTLGGGVGVGVGGEAVWDICLQLWNTSPSAPLSPPKPTAISCTGPFHHGVVVDSDRGAGGGGGVVHYGKWVALMEDGIHFCWKGCGWIHLLQEGCMDNKQDWYTRFIWSQVTILHKINHNQSDWSFKHVLMQCE